MFRVSIGSALVGLGYLLLYAAVAERGKYALRPWNALEAGWGPPGGASGSGAGNKKQGLVSRIIGVATGALKRLINPFGGIPIP